MRLTRLILASFAVTGLLAVVGCTFVSSLIPGSGSSAQGGDNNANSSKKPVSVAVNPSSVVIAEQSQQQITATVQYSDGTADSGVKWSSSDGTIISVNQTTGMVTALKQGVASVVAVSSVDSSKQAIVTVTVKPSAVTDAYVTVSPSAASIGVRGTVQLTASVTNSAGQTGSNYTWSSSSQGVATVTNGLVTGIAPGTAIITATSQQDPTKIATASISVL